MSDNAAMITASPLARTIVLKSCYGKTNHKLHLEPCRNGRTGQWLGVQNLSEEQKRLATYYVEPGKVYLEIIDGYTFDLSKEKDRIDWAWVKECPQIAGAREETSYKIKGDEQEDFTSYEGADKEFFVFDEENESLREEKRNSREFEALRFIYEQSQTQLYRVARLLGSNMENSKPGDVRNFLNSKARKHPEQVLRIADDPASEGKLFLYAAIDKEVIRKRAGVYYYNETALGTTEEQVLLWLTEDRNYTLVRAITLEIQPGKVIKAPVSQANVALFQQALGLLPTEQDGDDEHELDLEAIDALAADAPAAGAPLTRAQSLARARAART